MRQKIASSVQTLEHAVRLTVIDPPNWLRDGPSDSAVRLLLSGGSHRATLGSMGAIAYFLWSESQPARDDGRRYDRWSDIDEIVSVSGGSLLNASLAGATDSAESTARELADIRRRIIADALRPHRTMRRLLITMAGLAALLASLWVVLAALGVVGPSALSQSPWSLVIGIGIVPVLLNVGRRVVAAYQRDVIDAITLGTDTQIETVRSSRRHTICASGLASGLPYYFTIGGDRPFEPTYGTAISSGYSVADAATASMALPGLGRIRAPQSLRREVLVDGGVSGGFGEQVANTIERRPEDTWRSDGDWFAVDAVRHMRSNARVGQLVQSVSMISLLSRWLKVSLEATYVNDLIDLGPGQYARIWSANVLPRRAPDPGQTFRDGSAKPAPEAPIDTPERQRLGDLQASVSEMGLTSMNRASADLAIVVGFVSTLEVRRGLTTSAIIDGLSWLDQQLGADGQLLTTWAGTTASGRRNDAASSSPER